MTIAILNTAFQPATAAGDVHCTTPACVAVVTNFGPSCSKVQPLLPLSLVPFSLPHATHHCARCGGFGDGTTWVHECLTCGQVVEAGTLAGPARAAFCIPCSLKPNCGLPELPVLPR